jgi:hypothetical protein
MITSSTGWALVHCASATIVLATQSGGKHWQAYPAPKTATRIQALTGSTAYVATAAPMEFQHKPPIFRLWLTTTSGHTWRRISGPAKTGPLMAFHFLNRRVGWVATMATTTTPSLRHSAPDALQDQLWETTMCDDTRHLIPIIFTRDELPDVERELDKLMSKQSIAARKAWIEVEGSTADVDI